MSLDEINERNEQIAKFLGWWQDPPSERPYTWWENNGFSITSVCYELTFHKDWNQLMLAVQAISRIPMHYENPREGKIKYILLDEIKIGRLGIYLHFFKDSIYQEPFESAAILYQYVPNEPNRSNADSYMEAIWLGVSDFCKSYNEYTEFDPECVKNTPISSRLKRQKLNK
jgi:hypothetical protein